MASTVDELLSIEHAGWEALTTSGDAAADFYDERLADDVLMLLPGGMVLADRDEIIDSMSGEPWESHELEDEQVLILTGDCAVVSYRGRAVRGDTTYEALFNSTYVRDGDWYLAVHQQTPV